MRKAILFLLFILQINVKDQDLNVYFLISWTLTIKFNINLNLIIIITLRLEGVTEICTSVLEIVTQRKDFNYFYQVVLYQLENVFIFNLFVPPDTISCDSLFTPPPNNNNNHVDMILFFSFFFSFSIFIISQYNLWIHYLRKIKVLFFVNMISMVNGQ